MRVRTIFVALLAAAALGACERDAGGGAETAQAPELDAPAPDSAPSRTFAATSESARAATGRLTVTMTTRMPDAEKQESGPVDVLSLRAETGLTAEATLEGSVAPSASVEGQTIRALMNLDVSASQLMVYRIVSETAPRGGRGLCSEGEATRLVVWESPEPGEQTLKMLALSGDAPGEAGARICSAFAYTRAAN